MDGQVLLDVWELPLPVQVSLVRSPAGQSGLSRLLHHSLADVGPLPWDIAACLQGLDLQVL